jgi:hypothetical protein
VTAKAYADQVAINAHADYSASIGKSCDFFPANEMSRIVHAKKMKNRDTGD